MRTLAFTVHGKPQPAGSKRAVFKKGGRPIVFDDNARAKPWQAEVKAAAIDALNGGELLTGPLQLDVTFAIARPKGHYGKRGLLPSAPLFVTVRPDVTKLLRGLEDALTGVLWRDDAQVVKQHACKVYTEDGATYTHVRLTPMTKEEA